MKVKIKVSNLERLDKVVVACNIWQHFTHKIDFTKHELNTPIYWCKCLERQKGGGVEKRHERGGLGC